MSTTLVMLWPTKKTIIGRERHDRNGLAGDDVGRERALGQAGVNEGDCQADAEDSAQREADERLAPGVERLGKEVFEQELIRPRVQRGHHRRPDVPDVGKVGVRGEPDLQRRVPDHLATGCPPRVAADELDPLPEHHDHHHERDEDDRSSSGDLPARRAQGPLNRHLRAAYATAASVISRARSMISKPSAISSSLIVSGGFVKNVFQRTKV